MKKQILCLSLAVVMAVGCFTGCKKRTGRDTAGETKYTMDPILNEPGVFPVVKEEYKDTTLKIGIAQSALVTDYENNTFTQALEKKLGCNLDFDLLPSADTQQKVELMIAAGGNDLPDVLILSFNDGQLYAYGQNGTIVDLKPYYENSTYYIQQMFDNEMEKYNTDVKKLISLSNGSMYYVPQYHKALQNEFPAKFWMYQPWLDTLNLKKPTTLKELKKVLTAFKNDDPNGNGKKDEIPLSGNKGDFLVDYILSSFVPLQKYQSYMYVDEDGKTVKAAFMQEGWRQGLKYLNDLYKNGLLSDTVFTQDSNQFTQVKSAVPNIVGSYCNMSCAYSGELMERTLEYTYVPPLSNGKNEPYSLWCRTEPYCRMVVTKNCKHPELAFRLGDVMSSLEMTIWNRWGEKGVDWLEPKEGEKSLFADRGCKALITPVLVWGQPSNHHWQNIGPGYRDYEISLGMTASSTSYSEQQISRALASYEEKKYKNIQLKYIYDVDDFSTVSDIRGNVDNYVNEQIALFVTGAKDLDKGWDEYIDHLKSIGAEDYVALTQKAYDKNTLGKK